MMQVIMGGGYQFLNSNATGTANDPIDEEYGCIRKDKRNLIQNWVDAKKDLKHAFVRTKSNLKAVRTSEVDYLLGKSWTFSS